MLNFLQGSKEILLLKFNIIILRVYSTELNPLIAQNQNNNIVLYRTLCNFSRWIFNGIILLNFVVLD